MAEPTQPAEENEDKEIEAPPSGGTTPPGGKPVPETSDIVVKKEASRRKKDLEVRVSEQEDEITTLKGALATLQAFLNPKPPEKKKAHEMDNFLFGED